MSFMLEVLRSLTLPFLQITFAICLLDKVHVTEMKLNGIFSQSIGISYLKH